MKKSKCVVLIIGLVILTGIAAVVHLKTRDEVSEGTVRLIYGEQTYELEIAALDYEQVTGIRVNGKGEEIQVDASGISLKKVLDEKNITEYTSVSVVADDSYSAQLTVKEVNQDSKAYLLWEEEELRLIVFGDENSKRSVSHVVQIVVE